MNIWEYEAATCPHEALTLRSTTPGAISDPLYQFRHECVICTGCGSSMECTFTLSGFDPAVFERFAQAVQPFLASKRTEFDENFRSWMDYLHSPDHSEKEKGEILLGHLSKMARESAT